MTRTLLLADDSLAIQRVVDLTFAESDFEVVSTGNGDEALAAFERLAPAVVLADVHMPGASGYDVARGVKDRSPETPVLLLVGTFEAFDEARSGASGADGHLLKPFDAEELRAWVEGQAPPASGEAVAEEAVSEEAVLEEPVSEEPVSEEAASEDRVSEETVLDAGTAPEAGERDPDSDAESPSALGAIEAASRAPSEEVTAAPESSGQPSPETGAEDPSASEPSDPLDRALTSDEVERIARRVVELISVDAVREIAQEVVPRVARETVQRRIEELESEQE